MAQALSLAKRGGRAVRPNPRVGAVVVKNGRRIAAAYHSRYGGPHAEVKALEKAGRSARGATLYVNLEPCSTYGKTPPCTDLIVRSGIKRVVVGCLDRNPPNRGRAKRILEKAGISFASGVRESEAFDLNRDFFTWAELKRPYTVLKLALSLDGKIATRTGDSRWITSKEGREFAHYLRGKSDGVLVGINTVLQDDPRLTVRMGYHGPRLKRVVLDSRGRLPLSARLLKVRPVSDTIVALTPRAPAGKRKKLLERGTTCLTLPSAGGRVNLKKLLKKLAALGVMRLLIEGGGEVAASILKEGLVDEVHLIIAPLIIGGKEAPDAVGGEGVEKLARAYRLKNLSVKKLGPDIHIWGYPV